MAVAVLGIVLTATACGRPADQLDDAVTVPADVGWRGGDTEQQRCVHVTFAPSPDPDHPGPQADPDLVAC